MEFTAPSISHDMKTGLSKISRQAIFTVGTHKGIAFTEKDLDRMVENFHSLHFLKVPSIPRPPAKLGHDDETNYGRRSGFPAIGWVSDLYREGKTLVADFEDVPYVIALGIEKKAFRTKSSEIQLYFDPKYEDAVGNNLGPVLIGVAFLGEEIPAVPDLNDLQTLYKTGENDEEMKAAESKSNWTRRLYSLAKEDATILEPITIKFSRNEGGENDMNKNLKKPDGTVKLDGQPGADHALPPSGGEGGGDGKPPENKPGGEDEPKKITVDEAKAIMSDMKAMGDELAKMKPDDPAFAEKHGKLMEKCMMLGEAIEEQPDLESVAGDFAALMQVLNDAGLCMASDLEAAKAGKGGKGGGKASCETDAEALKAENEALKAEVADLTEFLDALFGFTASEKSDTIKVKLSKVNEKLTAAKKETASKGEELVKASATIESLRKVNLELTRGQNKAKVASVIEKWKSEGKVLPAQEANLSRILEHAANTATTIKFSKEDGSAAETPMFDDICLLFNSLPKNTVLNLNETAAGISDPTNAGHGKVDAVIGDDPRFKRDGQ